jgi:peptide/nickel transport system permease protein
MIDFIAKRILYAVPICLAVALVCFSLVHIAPGDSVSAFLPPQASAELVAKVTRDLGLDRPLPIQFGQWLWRALHGDFGTSIATGRPVAQEVWPAFANSLILALIAVPLAVGAGSLLGFVAGTMRGTVVDRGATIIAMAGVSVPHYWLAIVLVIFFSVQHGMLPAMGAGPGGSADWRWDWEHLRFAILPAISMAVVPTAIIARTVRAVVVEVLGHEFVQALRAKGLGRWSVLQHISRNAAPTSISVVGIQVGYLLGGSILIETVFAWPGAGFLINNAIFQRDLPVLQATVFVLTLTFVGLNLFIDIIQALLDPRIQRY